MNRRELQKQLYNNSILEFIWYSAKSNPNWNIVGENTIKSLRKKEENNIANWLSDFIYTYN